MMQLMICLVRTPKHKVKITKYATITTKIFIFIITVIVKAVRCDACNKMITVGKPIKVQNKTMHEDCFKCDQCHKKITGQYIFENNQYKCNICGSASESPSQAKNKPFVDAEKPNCVACNSMFK